VPPPPSYRNVCKEPLKTFTSAQIALLDPAGSRTRLFDRSNPEAAKVGDILLVRQKTGEPFSGVCMNIRRRGQDTSILLRNQLTRVGVEMWFKIYSPAVTGIEVVQRREKRARRARLYYMRKPKHDLGSVENIVRQYLRQKALLGSKNLAGRGNAQGPRSKKGKKR
jgi:large subunit ribosomal protein L19